LDCVGRRVGQQLDRQVDGGARIGSRQVSEVGGAKLLAPVVVQVGCGPGDAPDGFALARSGHIYVALVGASNQVVELSSTGQEMARFGQQYTGANDSPVPFDSPSGVVFEGTQLLIANQSYFTGTPANQAVLSVETREPGQPVYVPAGAGLPPAAAGNPPGHHHRRHRHHRASRHHRRAAHGHHSHQARPKRHHAKAPDED
jgi:hypothetical protein